MPKNNQLSVFSRNTLEIIDKTETYAGKHTARVTHTSNQPDGSQVRRTRKINKDGTITDKVEHRHN